MEIFCFKTVYVSFIKKKHIVFLNNIVPAKYYNYRTSFVIYLVNTLKKKKKIMGLL